MRVRAAPGRLGEQAIEPEFTPRQIVAVHQRRRSRVGEGFDDIGIECAGFLDQRRRAADRAPVFWRSTSHRRAETDVMHERIDAVRIRVEPSIAETVEIDRRIDLLRVAGEVEQQSGALVAQPKPPLLRGDIGGIYLAVRPQLGPA